MANKNPTSGGAKGGKRFPKINLEKSVEYSKRLVSKTHNSPQPKEVVLPGVFDSNTWLGGQRLSATKLYGLLKGDSKAYTATELAKQINSATKDEIHSFLKKACIKPEIFNSLYNTFHNETTSKAKLKQQALTLGVHPDKGEECVDIFVESLVYSGLATIVDSDKIEIIEAISQNEEIQEEIADETDKALKEESQKPPTDNQKPSNPQSINTGQFQSTKKQQASNINVNIDIDPSMDPEKLEKLLKLLKGYGAI